MALREVYSKDKSSVKLIYKPPTSEMKNHPKYKIAQQICKDTQVVRINDSTKNSG